MDEADWEAAAAHTELEGEVLLAFVTDTAAWITDLRRPDAPPVRRVVDIGSGPGVGTCELARRFPDAQVIAVDASPSMLGGTAKRADAHGLESRVSTHLAELPGRLEGLSGADVVWASMSLHHVGDEVAALRVLRDLLDADGLLAIAEMAEPMRVLPDDLDMGRPGLADRLADAGTRWFADMRAGLEDSVPSTDLPSMVAAAGLEVVGSRVARVRLDPPLGAKARRHVVGHVRRLRHQLADYLDDDDLVTLDSLMDDEDPRSVAHRPDVFLASSRQIVIARPKPDPLRKPVN
jgi:SAM-dependent methyltransferase